MVNHLKNSTRVLNYNNSKTENNGVLAFYISGTVGKVRSQDKSALVLEISLSKIEEISFKFKK